MEHLPRPSLSPFWGALLAQHPREGTQRNRNQGGTPHSRDLYQRALQLQQRKEYESALQLLEAALRDAPDAPDCLALSASVLRRMGHYALSAQYAAQAIHRDPNVGWYHATWAFANFYDGNMRVAQPALEHVITLGVERVGEGNIALAQKCLNELRERQYLITWNITPVPQMVRDGLIVLPAPVAELPYQSVTWEIGGIKPLRFGVVAGRTIILIEPNGEKPFRFMVRATVRAHTMYDAIASVAHQAPASPEDLPSDVRLHLEADRHVSIGPHVREVAALLRAATALETVKNTVWWLENRIRYERISYKDSEEVLTRGSGDCGGHSSLFAALCRANSIPARMVWGVTKAAAEFCQPDQMSGHVWAECYLDGVGWVPVEPQYLNLIGFVGTERVLFYRYNNQPNYWFRALNRQLGTYTPTYQEISAE